MTSDYAYQKLIHQRQSSSHTYQSETSHYKHSERKKNRPFPIRTGLAAVALFTIGVALFIASFVIGLDEEHRGISIFLLGLIAFIPGSYAVTQLYGSYMGWKGYSYDQIPSYDD